MFVICVNINSSNDMWRNSGDDVEVSSVLINSLSGHKIWA